MANCDPFTNICDEPPAEEPMMEEDMDMEEMWEPNDDEKMWMFEANLAMLMMAAEIGFMGIMDLTSWRWANVATLTYSDGTEEDIPWDFENEWWLLQDGELGNPLYKWAAMIHTYTSTVLGSTMFITQMLSMLGIAAGVNMMVWGYGMMAMGLIGFICNTMTFFQHWFTWMMVSEEDLSDDTIADVVSDADLVAGFALIEEIEWEWFKVGAQVTMGALTWWAYGEAWAIAQWWALPEEERAAAWEAMEEEGEKDDDMGGKGKKMMLNRLF